MKRVAVHVVALLIPLALLTACGKSGNETVAPVTPTSTALGVSESTSGMSASRVKDYVSIRQLRDESLAIVRVTVTNNRSIEYVDKIPFTVTTATVDQVLLGFLPEKSVKIRQLGDGKTIVTESVPLLQSGRSYVVFLQRFTYGPGKETDQYVPTGGVGLYLDQEGSLQRVDPRSSRLPATLPPQELERQIAG